MRKSVTACFIIPALAVAGCGKGPAEPAPPAAPGVLKESLVPPPVASGGQTMEAVVTIDAGKEGGTRVGPALVSVKRVWETKNEGVPTITVAIGVKNPEGGTAFAVKGWSTDYDLVAKLTGLKASDRTTAVDPLPVTFRLTADGKEKCRGTLRFINHDPEKPQQNVEVTTREKKVMAGDSVYLLYEFERPSRGAKDLAMEFAGEDIGHTGRVKVRIPASLIVRE